MWSNHCEMTITLPWAPRMTRACVGAHPHPGEKKTATICSPYWGLISSIEEHLLSSWGHFSLCGGLFSLWRWPTPYKKLCGRPRTVLYMIQDKIQDTLFQA